ncbi:hypothetical protein TNCT_124851, partial [Trichonephila clavata]
MYICEQTINQVLWWNIKSTTLIYLFEQALLSCYSSKHERSELEMTYAKNLSKLAAKINKATRLTLGTTQHAWQEVALQMENEADTH